jgi:hypothetical protein
MRAVSIEKAVLPCWYFGICIVRMVAVFAEVQMFAAFPYIILFQVSLGAKVILLICSGYCFPHFMNLMNFKMKYHRPLGGQVQISSYLRLRCSLLTSLQILAAGVW